MLEQTYDLTRNRERDIINTECGGEVAQLHK